MEVPLTTWALTVAAIVGLLVFDLIYSSRRPHAVGFREAIGWSVGVHRDRPDRLRGLLLVRFWAGPEYGAQFRGLPRREEPFGRQPVRLRHHHGDVHRAPALSSSPLTFGIPWALICGRSSSRSAPRCCRCSRSCSWSSACSSDLDGREALPPPRRGAGSRRRRAGGDRPSGHAGSAASSSRHSFSHGDGRDRRPAVSGALTISTTELLFTLTRFPPCSASPTSHTLSSSPTRSRYSGFGRSSSSSGLLDRLIYLSTGLAFILVFIGVKLILHYGHLQDDSVPEISTGFSLGVIVAILAITTVASVIKVRRDPTARARAGSLRDHGADPTDADSQSPSI